MRNDWNDRLDEYLDGMLAPEEARQMEEALARDPVLRAELESVRRFAGLLEEQTPDGHAVFSVLSRMRARKRRRRLLLAAVPLAGAAAAALAIVLLRPPTPPEFPYGMREIAQEWLAFGERLGDIAAERREGRVPRSGVGSLEIPPASAYGIVFKGALGRLDVPLDRDAEERVLDLVRRHHEAMRRRGSGLLAEYDRAEASLSLYRDLARIGGRDVADAYYDVFRPGLTDPETAERVRPDSLQFVVADHERYREAYREAVAELRRRFGDPSVAVVLEQLAPKDFRALWYDATLEGVGREAVLEIRAQLYEAALAAGADKLYVEG
jgi:anti-sigma factor RsiW